MKAAEYIETVYGTRKFALLLINQDAIGVMDLMDAFAERSNHNTQNNINMKRITAVLLFEAQVPDDMSNQAINNALEKKFENDLDDFLVKVEGYHDEDESEILFIKDSIKSGESISLSIG